MIKINLMKKPSMKQLTLTLIAVMVGVAIGINIGRAMYDGCKPVGSSWERYGKPVYR